MAIDSDVPNPDSALWVQFYKRRVVDEYATEQQGREVTRSVDFVKITIPSNPLLTIDTFVNEMHKRRFPFQWQAYVNNLNEQETLEQTGTVLERWPELTDAQREELRASKFYTVEQLAGAGDAALQNLGMRLGGSPHALRDKAKAFLKVCADSAHLFKAERENAELKQQLAHLQHQVDSLSAPRRDTIKLGKKADQQAA